jgi:hypothetical protein
MNPHGKTRGGSAALAAGRAARAYGAAPPASRLLRIAAATALRAGPDPGDLCGPCGRKDTGRTGLPRLARGPPRDQPAWQRHPEGTTRDQVIPYPSINVFPSQAASHSDPHR